MRSQRLTYRPIEARDAGRIALLAGDWDVARMTSRIPHPYSLIDADLWIASIDHDEFVRGVEQGGELIGAVGYISGEPGQAEIGYWIAAEARRRGIGATATRMLAVWALTHLGLERLELA